MRQARKTGVLAGCAAAAVAGALGSAAAYGAVITVVADTTLQRGAAANASNVGTNQALIVKNGDATDSATTDRVTALRFDTSALAGTATAAASLSLTVFPNAVPAGFTVQLYGIPDASASENFGETTLTFANSGFVTNPGTTAAATASDGTDNNVLDSALVSLGTFTFPAALGAAATGGNNGVITFNTPALASFIAADTNGVASFVLTTPTVNTAQTVAFYSKDNAVGQAFPTLATNADAVAVPEPATAAVVAAAAAATGRRRRPRR